MGTKPIYHLVEPAAWQARGPDGYRPPSLTTEGFVHCSYADQVARVANSFYADVDQLLLLTIDPARLTSPVRDEDVGTGELFPHLFGPLSEDAVVAVESLRRDEKGEWVFPSNQ